MPATRYIRTPDEIDLAYRIFDGGPADLVLVPSFATAMEIAWERSGARRYYEGLAGFARVVEYDGRGSGLSGRTGSAPNLEVRIQDLGAVMFAVMDAAAVAAMFAATYPERVSSLVLLNPQVRTMWAEDYPWGTRPEETGDWAAQDWELWNSPEPTAELITAAGWAVGAEAEDADLRRHLAKTCRYLMTPREMRAAADVWMETDARHVLPSIQAPTVVLHAPEDDDDRGLYAAIAEVIPGATAQVLPGAKLVWTEGDVDEIVDAIAEHLRVERPPREFDRVLSTILFTDIVGSTQQAADMGDARWRGVIVEHERRARDVVTRHRGVFEHTTGDGLMARFDGPARAVRCAQEIAASVDDLGIQIRAGVHTGEIELTEAGAHGLGVHVAARVAAKAGPFEVWTSSTVKDLVAGSGLTFEDAGEHELKGVPDRWHLYRVVG